MSYYAYCCSQRSSAPGLWDSEAVTSVDFSIVKSGPRAGLLLPRTYMHKARCGGLGGGLDDSLVYFAGFCCFAGPRNWKTRIQRVPQIKATPRTDKRRHFTAPTTDKTEVDTSSMDLVLLCY